MDKKYTHKEEQQNSKSILINDINKISTGKINDNLTSKIEDISLTCCNLKINLNCQTRKSDNNKHIENVIKVQNMIYNYEIKNFHKLNRHPYPYPENFRAYFPITAGMITCIIDNQGFHLVGEEKEKKVSIFNFIPDINTKNNKSKKLVPNNQLNLFNYKSVDLVSPHVLKHKVSDRFNKLKIVRRKSRKIKVKTKKNYFENIFKIITIEEIKQNVLQRDKKEYACQKNLSVYKEMKKRTFIFTNLISFWESLQNS